jgi:hypothetical protein
MSPEKKRERESGKERAAFLLYSDAMHRSATFTQAYIQEKENKIEHTV